MKKAKSMALSGVLAALAVALMSLGGLIPSAAYCGPMLAGLMLLVVFRLCGNQLAWVWYMTVALLSLLLCPNLESSLVFCGLGYYPILRCHFEKIKSRLLRLLCKLLFFYTAAAVILALLLWLMGLEQLLAGEKLALGMGLLWALLATATFLLLDKVLGRAEKMLRARLGRNTDAPAKQ